MGSTRQTRRRGEAQEPSRSAGASGPPWVLIGGVVAVVAVAAILLFPGAETAPGGSLDGTLAENQTESAFPEIPTREASPKPPPDAPLPALPLVPNLVPRTPDVIRSAYAFAARNPEILEYVPCFCGCETAGHTGNADCFVAERNADGSVREWDTHGMSCMVCIDVAVQSQQLHASGASVRDIRSAIEANYAGSPRHTPTPAAPSN